jgi:predicted dehydrogenase
MGDFRIAVIGCGAVAANHHLPALATLPDVEIVALVDRDLGRARALAERWDVPTATDAFEGVAARVDGAIVALPNHLHAPVSCELLRQGIHVLVEKPMAPTVGECDAMIAAAAESGAVLAVGLEFRFFASTHLVRALLEQRLLGELRGFELRQGVVPRWPFASDFMLRRETAGGGVLADFGAHVLDLLLYWLGEWEDVACADDARGGLESDCELELTMRGGLRGLVEISRTRDLRNTCRFEGERGTLEVGVWDPAAEISLCLPGCELRLAGHASGGEAGEATFAGAFRRQLADFVAAARSGVPPSVPGEEGRRAVALVEACYARRRPLELPWEEPPELAAWREGAAGR